MNIAKTQFWASLLAVIFVCTLTGCGTTGGSSKGGVTLKRISGTGTMSVGPSMLASGGSPTVVDPALAPDDIAAEPDPAPDTDPDLAGSVTTATVSTTPTTGVVTSGPVPPTSVHTWTAKGAQKTPATTVVTVGKRGTASVSTTLSTPPTTASTLVRYPVVRSGSLISNPSWDEPAREKVSYSNSYTTERSVSVRQYDPLHPTPRPPAVEPRHETHIRWGARGESHKVSGGSSWQTSTLDRNSGLVETVTTVNTYKSESRRDVTPVTPRFDLGMGFNPGGPTEPGPAGSGVQKGGLLQAARSGWSSRR